MLGNSANVQNNRFFHGAIDDIGFYDHVITQREVDILYHAGNPTIGIKDNISTQFMIFPNPVQEELTVTGEQISAFRLMDQLGKELMSGSPDKNGRIDLQNLSNGVYFLEITDIGGARITRKIIKK
jgi:hypothetical protein